MKERQRWRPEEDSLLRAYVRQHGPRDWHLVSERMHQPLDRDSKSCLERWKNYLKPGIKKGSLTDDEQRLVIRLQAKHGNKWKKIASEVPGRTAKRLGKWWEVFKEKQQRGEHKAQPVVDDAKYDTILETFAEKLVNQDIVTIMPTADSNGNGFVMHRHTDQPGPPVLPPWMAGPSSARSPSVTLSLSPSAGPPIPWLPNNNNGKNSPIVSEIVECCRELEEGHRAWAAHRKEAGWRLRRVELQLESEKACRRREKAEEIEAKVRALREEERATLERIEGEYREQLAGLRREAEGKEQKLAEQWAAKHLRLTKFLEQMGCRDRV